MDPNQTQVNNINTNAVIVHQKACKNCFKLHRKCNKQMPCDYCSLRGKPCEINPCIKKRGRPIGSTNKTKIKEEKEVKKQKKLGRPKKSEEKKKEKERQLTKPIVDEVSFNVDTLSPVPANSSVQVSKTCFSCQASLIENAKFCTNCGMELEKINSVTLHTKLDTLRFKNIILEQQYRLSAEYSNQDKKNCFSSTPSWDYCSNLENGCITDGLESNLQSNSCNQIVPINPPPRTSNSNIFIPTRISNSNLFENIEPAVYLDSSFHNSDHIISWAFNFDQNFKKENTDDQSSSSHVSSTLHEFPLFKETYLPKF